MTENAEKVDTLENWRKRLIFRSWHRGTKEMDLLLGNFANINVPAFNEEQLQAYEELLSINDPDLYNMYLGKREPDEDQKSSILDAFLSFVLKPA